MNAALTRVDNTIESLFAGLKERGVENCVNVIIVSDHGMATYDPTKLVHLKEVNKLTIVIILQNLPMDLEPMLFTSM